MHKILVLATVLIWTSCNNKKSASYSAEQNYNSSKQYHTLSAFGEKIDLSTILATEQYEIGESNEGYVFSLINKSPILIKEVHNNLIKNGIKEWFELNLPEAEYDLPENIYQKIKYKSSRLFVTNLPVDVYEIDIPYVLPNDKGIALLEGAFTSQYFGDEREDDSFQFFNQSED